MPSCIECTRPPPAAAALQLGKRPRRHRLWLGLSRDRPRRITAVLDICADLAHALSLRTVFPAASSPALGGQSRGRRGRRPGRMSESVAQWRP